MTVPPNSQRLAERYDPFADLERRHPDWEYLVVPLGDRQKKVVLWDTKTALIDRDKFIENPDYCMANVVAHIDGGDLPAADRDTWARHAAAARLAD